MKICSIYIKEFQQFKGTYLDFTNPETGEPINQVCFIGRNGTGKSTILSSIFRFLVELRTGTLGLKFGEITGGFIDCIIKLKNDSRFCYFFFDGNASTGLGRKGAFLNENFKMTDDFISKWNEVKKPTYGVFYNNELLPFVIPNTDTKQFKFTGSSGDDLVVYSPSESPENAYLKVSDVPVTSLSNALELFTKYPVVHTVSQNTIADFWRHLIFLIKRRENEREIFETAEENIDKTKKQLMTEFEEINPRILQKLGDLWNRILDKAGLEFDVKNAKAPFQLNENLLAYVNLKDSGKRITYNQLSTGIRNFIFRVGHIKTLYFNRIIENGFLLIDEPENSLFPDFLFDLVNTYQEILFDKRNVNNTQMFMSTHSPIIAAQFEPFERIILEWNQGSVQSFKGIAPAGDDPNDILIKDFKLKTVMGKKRGRDVE